MKSLRSKVRRIATAGGNPVNWTPANRIVNWILAAAVIFLLASEEHARRTWRDRALESQENLTSVRKFLVLEREHVKKLSGGVQ